MILDTDVTSIAIGRLQARWHHRVTDRNRVVVEVKHGIADDSDAHRVTAWFPFRVARNSKYAHALEALAL